MKHRTIRGRILYTSNKPDRLGHERGRESFTITVHTGGKRTLRALCEIDDPPTVLRDVTLSVDADYYPLDCFTRLTLDDKFEGSGWMRFTPGRAETEVFNVNDGRISQRFELERRIRWLASHPIAGDGMGCCIYDLGRGPGRMFFPDMMVTSTDHRGASGPLLFKLGFGIEYVGDERITVPAGEFDAHHFRYVDTAGQLPKEHPDYDVWCTTDGDYIFLRGAVGGYMQTFYELVELER